MKLASIFFLASVFLVSCTSKPEDKVAAALDKAFGKEKIKKEMNMGLTKLLGEEQTTFRKSVFTFFMDNTKISYSDVKVEGAKATAKVVVEKPSDDEFTGLFLMAAMVDRQKLNNMTLDQFLAELSKGQRKTASLKDLRIEKFEGTVELDQAGDDWKLDEKAAKGFFAKNKKNKK